MKYHLSDVEEILKLLASATVYARQARHVARKIHGKDEEVSANLNYVYRDIQKASRIMDGQK